MEFSTDPEINCVFCGLGFNSVEKVECHILDNHQSNNIDNIDNQKLLINKKHCDNNNKKMTNSKHCFNNGLKSGNIPSDIQLTKRHRMKCHIQFHQRKYHMVDGLKVRNQEPPENSLSEHTLKAKNDGKKQKCHKCFKTFLFHSTLLIHLQNHGCDNKYRLTCDKCGFKYSTKQVMVRHSIRGCVLSLASDPCVTDKPPNSEWARCLYCHTTFLSTAYLEMHQRRVCPATNHNSAKKYHRITSTSHKSFDKVMPESHLSERFSADESQPSVDQKYQSSSPDMSVKGSTSPKMIDNETLQKSEIVEEIAKDEQYHWHDHQKPFECEICKKHFSNRSSLSNHIKSHYSSRGQPFICRDCNQRFVNLISLQDHRRQVCCQKNSESKLPIDEDMMKYKPKPVYSLSNFNGVSQVPLWPNNNHTNPGSQPVTCVHCNGVFYDRLELEEHALTKHSDEQGNILCLLCERTFTTNMALRVHLTKSHGFANGGCPGVSQNLPPMPRLDTNYNITDEIPHKKRRRRLFEYEKEYSCENCHRNFSTGQALGNHRRACMNIPNELIPTDNKPNHSNHSHNSKLHSIESLIFDNKNIRSAPFNDDKNVFLAFH